MRLILWFDHVSSSVDRKKKRFLISREIHLQPWSDMLVIILFEREDQHSRWWHFRLARNQWIGFKPVSQSKSELQIDSSSQAKSCNYVWYNGDMLKLVTVRKWFRARGVASAPWKAKAVIFTNHGFNITWALRHRRNTWKRWWLARGIPYNFYLNLKITKINFGSVKIIYSIIIPKTKNKVVY